jgi:galactokinase
MFICVCVCVCVCVCCYLCSDATLDQLNAVESMMDETAFYRARHVITENDRTVQAAVALSQNAYKRLGQLMTHSHVSMKNDYEISCDEVDCLVDIALELPRVYGSRMTGGGFGGQ